MKSILFLLSPLLAIGCAATGSSSGSGSGRTLTDTTMAADTQAMLNKIEAAYAIHAPITLEGRGASAERGAKIQDRKVVSQPNNKGVWMEDWRVAREGGHAVYTITFTPAAAATGSDISIGMPPRVVVP